MIVSVDLEGIRKRNTFNQGHTSLYSKNSNKRRFHKKIVQVPFRLTRHIYIYIYIICVPKHNRNNEFILQFILRKIKMADFEPRQLEIGLKFVR